MKIKTYFIPPIKHLDLSLMGDRLFALAHFILKGNKKYIRFFKKHKDKFITLDSGVAEGSRVPIKEFMKCASKINANEIICPDELWDTDKTIELTKEFVKGLTEQQRKKYKFMMVPQAKNIKDYVRCLKILQEMPECGCIGISKFDAPVLFGKITDKHKARDSRKRLVKYLADKKLIKKPVHLLGYDNPTEFRYYRIKNYKFIRSCDSASAILCGMRGIKFNNREGIKVPKPAGGDLYHISGMAYDQLFYAKHNIRVTKQLCGGK